MTDERCYASATALAAMIRRREASSAEIVAACLARIEAVNPRLNVERFTPVMAKRLRFTITETTLWIMSRPVRTVGQVLTVGKRVLATQRVPVLGKSLSRC